MLVPALLFVMTVILVFSGYMAIAALPKIRAELQLKRRLHDVSIPVAAPAISESILLRQMAGPLPALERMAAPTLTGKWLARLIQQSGIRTSPGAVLIFSLLSAGLFAVTALAFVRQPWAPALAAILGGAVPVGFLVRRRSIRMKRFEEQFPEALDLLSRAIRAGHAFQTAMNMVADELPDPVGPEFRITFDQQNFGLPLRDALLAMQDRVPIIDVRFFVTAVLIQRETGGNLSEILDNLSRVVRERFKVLRQVRVYTAHGRFTGYVLLALPVALAIGLSLINYEHMELLFREPMGQTMLTGAVILQIVGFFWIRRVIKIEV